MAPLDTYHAKRDFSRTSEPRGTKRRGRTADHSSFVIHKHAATRLHYDLRLEHDGVLWSWAVTRGPSLDPSERRLAVHVEDHPLDYATFEGTIPKAEYGGGAVLLWDRGTWAPEGDAAAGIRKGHLRFELDGEKLKGAWHLVRLKPRPREKRDNWLLIKSDDDFARTDADILDEAPLSVASGRDIDDVAAGAPASAKAVKGKAAGKAKATGSRKAPRSEKAAPASPPDFVEPCLATLRKTPPSGDEWLHEVKFDGYRTQARIEGGDVRLLTRSGLDWTEKFGTELVQAFRALDCRTALIDGEIVVLNSAGTTSFSALQQALSEKHGDRLLYYAFDLLHIDGTDLRDKPLAERKARLEALLPAGEGPLHYSEHFVEPGRTMLAHACRMGLEGVVSKRIDAPYRSGRGLDWLKSKCSQRQEFIIAGYLPSDAAGRRLRSLVMAYREDGALKPAGNVGTGFSQAAAADLMRRLKALRSKTSPFTGAAARQKGVVWVKPELVAEIEFRAWTDGGNLRHASFQGLREDKPADEVVAEHPEDDPARPPKPRATRKRASAPPRTSVALSSPDKALWPDVGLTKAGLLDYYAEVWQRIEPHIVDRPLSLVRAPDGIDGQRFFQKHASRGMHDAIRRMADPEDKSQELLYVSEFDGLAALVQFGVVEIHVWGSTIAALEQPDQIIFDLDPDEGLDEADVRAAAFDVRGRLEELDLPALVKVSGGKGYHVVVPLEPAADWKTVKTFAHDFARAMEGSAPERYTATLSKKARKGRIFIDYLRNGRGSTAIAPWSTRAKPKATVAVPISWAELEAGIGPAHFTVGSSAVAGALAGSDPWTDFDALRRPLKR